MVYLVEHFQKGTFEQEYWIPAHNERRESTQFKSNKELIRDDCGAPCWICGLKNDNEMNHVFEWAFWNAMDPRKVTNILEAIEFYDEKCVSSVKDPVRLQTAIHELEVKKPVIDSPDDIINLVVLCRLHHRLKNTGIHTLTFPIQLAIAGVPAEGGILSKEQFIIAAERVLKTDDELASIAANNYLPHR